MKPPGMCAQGCHDIDIASDVCRICSYTGKTIRIHSLDELRSTSEAKLAQLDEWQRNGIIDEPTRRKLLGVPVYTPISDLDDGRVMRTLATDRDAGQRFQLADVPGAVEDALATDLEAAKKRIAELEELAEQWRGSCAAADILRDQAIAARREVEAKNEARETLYGVVRNERDDLLRENAVLRRNLEATERKAAKR